MMPVPKTHRNRILAIAIAVAVVIAIVLVAVSYLTRDGADETTPVVTTDTVATETVAPDTSTAVALVAGIPQKGTVLGKAGTTVRLLQFEDFQCPVCKRYTDDALPALINEYVKPGLVRIDFRGLTFLGPDSEKALRIALAAGLQNRLWEVVGLFYENQGTENSGWVTDALIDRILGEVPGLDAAKVKVDAKSPAVTKQIAATQAEATALNVQGTPWFYVGVGFRPPYSISPLPLEPSAFRPALDGALKG